MKSSISRLQTVLKSFNWFCLESIFILNAPHPLHIYNPVTLNHVEFKSFLPDGNSQLDDRIRSETFILSSHNKLLCLQNVISQRNAAKELFAKESSESIPIQMSFMPEDMQINPFAAVVDLFNSYLPTITDIRGSKVRGFNTVIGRNLIDPRWSWPDKFDMFPSNAVLQQTNQKEYWESILTEPLTHKTSFDTYEPVSESSPDSRSLTSLLFDIVLSPIKNRGTIFIILPPSLIRIQDIVKRILVNFGGPVWEQNIQNITFVDPILPIIEQVREGDFFKTNASELQLIVFVTFGFVFFYVVISDKIGNVYVLWSFGLSFENIHNKLNIVLDLKTNAEKFLGDLLPRCLQIFKELNVGTTIQHLVWLVPHARVGSLINKQISIPLKTHRYLVSMSQDTARAILRFANQSTNIYVI